jgi:hypothetical protein
MRVVIDTVVFLESDPRKISVLCEHGIERRHRLQVQNRDSPELEAWLEGLSDWQSEDWLTALDLGSRDEGLEPSRIEIRIVGGAVSAWNDGCPALTLLPLRLILHSIPLVKFQRNLTGESAEDWIEKADRLAEAFRQYKVPVIPIATEDLELATKTFQLINRQGTRMSDLHMVHTLTYSSKFDLLQEIQDFKSDIFSGYGWGDIDEEWILNVCKLGLGLDVSTSNASRLSMNLKEDSDILYQAAESLVHAIEFLGHRCGVPSPYMVPYAYQTILLAEAFRVEEDPGEEVEELLEAWFWLTTLGGAFAGISGYRLGLVADDVREIAGRKKASWSFPRPFTYTPLPAKVDFKSVRIKGLALRLAARQEDGTRVLMEQRNRALTQLFPASKISRKLYSSPGNRVLASPEAITLLREEALSVHPIFTEPDLHIFSEWARQHLEEGDFDAFIETRKLDLEEDERHFIRPHAERFGFKVDE